MKTSQIEAFSGTILVADSFGEWNMSGSRPHAYTLDGPAQLSGRWGTSGTQTPAEPRRIGKKFNATMADGSIRAFGFKEAGYDGDIPQEISGTGDLSLLNIVNAEDEGIYDEEESDYTETINQVLRRYPETKNLIIAGVGGVTHAYPVGEFAKFMEQGGKIVLAGECNKNSTLT